MERRTLGDGRYELLDQIGQGGMATVWRARDIRLGVERAIKILQPQTTRTTQTAKERFNREARLMAQLEHPNIVPIHDVGIERNQIYMVMSLLRGGSVAEHLERNGALPARQACSVVLGVLRALITSHAHGVIHRDVKPQNVLIDDHGVPRLTDFGIARVIREDGVLTKTGAVMGTYAFMAPEQRSNAREADPRSDVYAVGALLVALLTAQPPYDLHHPESLASQSQALPAPLRPFVTRCTRFDPEERYSNAIEALTALQAAMAELPADPNEAEPLRPLLPIVTPQSTLYTVPPTARSSESASTPTSPPTAPRSRWWLAALFGGGAVFAAGSILAGIALVGLAIGWFSWPSENQAVRIPSPDPVTLEEPAPVEQPAPVVPLPDPAPVVPVQPIRPNPTPPPKPPEPLEQPVPQPVPPTEPTQLVRVAADPSATLVIDGVSMGSTPWSGPLSHGTHTLVFRDPAGSLRLRRPITVVEGGKLEYCWVLDTEEPCSR